MKTKSPPEVNTVDPKPSPIADAELQQLCAATQCATAVFRSFEEVRKVHECAVHGAVQDRAAVAAKFGGVRGPGDLLAIQAELLQRDVDGAVRYGKALCEATLEMQTHILRCCSPFMQNDVWLEAASAFDRATGPGTALSRT